MKVGKSAEECRNVSFRCYLCLVIVATLHDHFQEITTMGVDMNVDMGHVGTSTPHSAFAHPPAGGSAPKVAGPGESGGTPTSAVPSGGTPAAAPSPTPATPAPKAGVTNEMPSVNNKTDDSGASADRAGGKQDKVLTTEMPEEEPQLTTDRNLSI